MSVAIIKEKLERELSPVHLQITDNSWMHAGHAASTGGEATHVAILVVSPKFEGIGLMDQHRMVHNALKEEMANFIHAMELKTMTPSAWEKAKQAV